jgi:hypothetical protein
MFFFQYQLTTTNWFLRHDGFLFKDKRLCVPSCSMLELIVKEANGGRLMEHFKIT